MRKKSTAELVAEKPAPEEFGKVSRFPVTLVADGIRSLDNVGLLFRLADAFLAERLILCGITGYPSQGMNDKRPPHIVEKQDRRIEKTAIKTVPLVPWEYRESAGDALRGLKEKGYRVYALEQTDKSVSYLDCDFEYPAALVVGHEREGVGGETLALADKVLEIPMYGMGNSHNVAVAAALVLARMRAARA